MCVLNPPSVLTNRAYKTLEDEDLKFPLVYGEGKKVSVVARVCVRFCKPSLGSSGSICFKSAALSHKRGRTKTRSTWEMIVVPLRRREGNFQWDSGGENEREWLKPETLRQINYQKTLWGSNPCFIRSVDSGRQEMQQVFLRSFSEPLKSQGSIFPKWLLRSNDLETRTTVISLTYQLTDEEANRLWCGGLGTNPRLQ